MLSSKVRFASKVPKLFEFDIDRAPRRTPVRAKTDFYTLFNPKSHFLATFGTVQLEI